MAKILDQIAHENDIKQVDPKDYAALASEIRDFIIQSVSETGGHLASNLGVVELTMALHLCLDFPKDKLIWDVGHQSYTHKILTGRKDQFKGLRTYGGMSGFPKQKESCCDAFDTGHSSTSISAALGYAKAREIVGGRNTVVAVIGDGSMTGGMAYEALNNAARMNSNMIIVLNDNNMSISPNVGGLSKYLNNIRTNENYADFKVDLEKCLRKIPNVGDSMAKGLKKSKDYMKEILMPGNGFFEDLGIEYIGPVDGHNVYQMARAIKMAKRVKGAVIVHAITQKGRGYKPAEEDPSAFHGIGKFEVKTGKELATSAGVSYTGIFSMTINKMAEEDEKIVGISAAMPYGTGLYKFAKKFPNRFFDVGIAEEHAVTFAAGLAAGGLKPYVAIYSSFLQRAYDQMIHDVCIQELPVTFCIDRAGLVGADGETHQGIFDLSYLSCIPNMTVFAPKNKYELFDILRFSMNFGKPLAIRYPRGTAYGGLEEYRAPIVYGKSEEIYHGEHIALLAVGSMVETAEEIYEHYKKSGQKITVINARFVKPLDKEMIRMVAENYDVIVTMEENVLNGGFGQCVGDYIAKNVETMPKFLNVAIPDVYVEHGNVSVLKKELQMDAASIIEKIDDMYNK